MQVLNITAATERLSEEVTAMRASLDAVGPERPNRPGPFAVGHLLAALVDYVYASPDLDKEAIFKICEENMTTDPFTQTPTAQAVEFATAAPAPAYTPCTMVDLETLGKRPGCKLLSIGAVRFGPDGVGDQFYIAIKRDSQAGLVEDPETVEWWSRQSPEAQEAAFGDQENRTVLSLALDKFAAWARYSGPGTLVWGNGSDFDNPILDAAYAAVLAERPWGPWSGRCYRTLKGMRRGIKLVRSGTHHNALDDAISQAEHAVRLLNDIGGWEEVRGAS